MKRTYSYTIEKEYEGLRIDSYLKTKGYSAQNITDLKKMPEGIMLKGKRSNTDRLLKAGDQLVINYEENASSEKIPPVKLPLDIVYEDEDLIILNKPADMPTHPSLNNYENTLANGLMYYFNSKGEDFIFRAINRLDRDTTGGVLVAKNGVSGNLLSELLKKDLIVKEYVALVRGDVRKHNGTDEGIIDMPIGRVDNSTIEREVNFETGERAVTHYKVLSYNVDKNVSFVSFHLETGRTHQIRVHMKTIGYPLLGDHLYDPENYSKEGLTRQALHCRRISFTHPVTGEEVNVIISISKDIENML